jgi:hypothetical protein
MRKIKTYTSRELFSYKRSKLIQDGSLREESESMLPKVNSWRDAGDTPGRKNHQEEAKLQQLHTPSPHIASPCNLKWRNKEGSRTARCQLLTCLGDHQVSKQVAHGTP